MARSAQETRVGLNYLRHCRGTRYVGWNGEWTPNQPVFYMGAGKPPSPEVVRAKGVRCSGALNLFARFVRGKSIKPQRNPWPESKAAKCCGTGDRPWSLRIAG